MRRLRALLAAATLGGLAAPVCAGESLDRLAGLMAERLTLMDDVAAYQWLHRRPGRHPEGEMAAASGDMASAGVLAELGESGDKALLAAMDARAAARGMSKARRAEVRAFFEAQIGAAKARQRTHFALWRGRITPPEMAPDVVAEFRPQLERIADAMLATLPRAWLELQGSTGRAELRAARRLAGLPPGREDPAVAQAFAPLCKRVGLTATNC